MNEEDVSSDERLASFKSSSSASSPFEKKFTAAIKNLQNMAGLPVTGIVDEATKKMMATPRCGVPDRIQSKRKKRYIRQGSSWRKNVVSYNLTKYSKTSALSQTMVNNIISKAFKIWQDEIDITFEASGLNPDIKISFEKRRHLRCSDAFDGPDGTLAHAYFPEFGGDLHFDDEEWWTDGVSHGKNLLQVAVHELGHSLGLEHSNHRGAIMFPYYQEYDPKFKLHEDDVKGIRAVYGEPSKKRTNAPQQPTTTTTTKTARFPWRQPTTTTAATTTKSNDHCQYDRIDAVTSIDSVIVVFKGNKVHLMTRQVVAPKVRVETYEVREIFPLYTGGTVKAAYTTNEQFGPTAGIHLFIFEGISKWQYTLDIQKKKFYFSKKFLLTSSEFLMLDGAFVSSKNNRLYLFLGSDYYRISPSSTGQIEKNYPKIIGKYWPGVPNNIDAVFSYTPNSVLFEKATYFFKGKMVYLFDFTLDKVSQTMTLNHFMGCSGSTQRSGRMVLYNSNYAAQPKLNLFLVTLLTFHLPVQKFLSILYF
ncbi:hypothetical protein HELRODRAFT_108967 [Helobdella robusta]|uniref:Peptidase metallopeptidase domain-containing protein n=1 Tax=Helobdella robusta TaxID=6412 RepID=T1EEP4_HELRO|nr:hypothetical protein HELRODRAFT_108967 [Helobdella robusta]ESO10537.1 hypothetical protein HELRODRAFT_108967 [Helobdella robusta]